MHDVTVAIDNGSFIFLHAQCMTRVQTSSQEVGPAISLPDPFAGKSGAQSNLHGVFFEPSL